MKTIYAWCAAARAAQGLPPRVIREDDQEPRDRVSHGLYEPCAAALLGEPPELLDQLLISRLNCGDLITVAIGSCLDAPADVRAWLTEQTGGHPDAFAIFRFDRSEAAVLVRALAGVRRV